MTEMKEITMGNAEVSDPTVVENEGIEEEPRQCPRCGAQWVKTEPTLAQVREAIREIAEEYKNDIMALRKTPIPKNAVNPMYGYAGSIAFGVVSNEDKLHHDYPPDIKGECGTKYDIDAFMITDFASQVRKFNGKRWAYKHITSRSLENKLRKAHKGDKKPALKYIRGGKKGYSLVLYDLHEEERAYKKNVRTLLY